MATVLCVEDEPIIRASIVAELSAVGYRVIEAANGEEGLASILTNKPDLVLCDITMPVMSGFEMLLDLRKNHKQFDDMPLILVSALAQPKNVIEGMRLGGDDYLTKPLDFDKLLATVHAWISKPKSVIRRTEARHDGAGQGYARRRHQGAGDRRFHHHTAHLRAQPEPL